MKSRFHLFLVLCAVMTAGYSGSSAQETSSFSLDEAVEMALENNADIAMSELQVAGSQYAIHESKGNFLPKVSLNGTYTRNIDKPVIFLPETFGWGRATQIGSDNNFTTYLDLSLPLYSKYNISARKVAYGKSDLQKEVLTGERQQVVANVKKGYFKYLLAQAVVTVREKALANAVDNFQLTRDRVGQGVATEFDQASAEVKVASARNNLLEAESQIIPAGNDLKILLGLSLETPIVLTDSISLTEQELSISENQEDLSNNATLKQQEIKFAINRMQTELLKASFYPLLEGVGMYQYQSQQNHFNFSDYAWVHTSSVGLRLKVPLFNGTVTRNQVQQSLMTEKIAKVQLDYTAGYNRSKFQQLVSSLKFIKQRIELQSDNIKLAARALELVKERYHYGRASVLEVNNAELDYVTARLNYLQALAEYKSAYCDLELLKGL